MTADKSVAAFKKLVAIGAPGSGKSMLLRSLSLAYAEGRLAGVPGNPVPILLELNRLNDSNDTLETHLVTILALNDFPHGEDFVNTALAKGQLLLLFDGLDEVNVQRRPAVVKQIQDLLDKYEKCRAIITCRNAVYSHDFVDIVDATFELVEFNDQQIARFLGAWKTKMHGDRSVEQLMHTLRDRPRIMALARNPLLLTVIAYMYTDTDFALPHNRSAFYEQSTNVLLGILQHLALFNQERRGESGPGGRSIDLQTTLSEVKKVLPDLNIPLDKAQSIIEEIVERSGLLLSIDGGTKYQFAHLTIQEYFAAVALQNDQDGLVNRFRIDQNAWRETLMLWCGQGHDSSDLIGQIAELDSITAFECLADAQKVAPTIADTIIAKFAKSLHDPDQVDEKILRAFAAVASDARPRGVATFEILQKLLAEGNSQARDRAAAALSFTNLPKAADVLARWYLRDERIRQKLVRLGNLAIEPLVALAIDGSAEAVDDLCSISTHEAIIQVIDLIWHVDGIVNIRAARQLGGMLNRLEFLEVLIYYKIPIESKDTERLDWVWRTDVKSPSAMQAVVGRIAYLLQNATKLGPSDSTVSPFIVIPLLIDHQQKIRMKINEFVMTGMHHIMKTFGSYRL
jgi:hypothetical protein